MDDIVGRKKTVMLTGITGAMGSETLKEFLKHPDKFDLRLLIRPSKKNKRKMAKHQSSPGITIIWGDLTNYEDVSLAMEGADYVLHLGGMVSPLADHFPQKTLEVNVKAAENIVEAARNLPNREEIKLVYIGSVAMTAHHNEPLHWGRTGDPIMTGVFDYYGISKIKAERVFAESGLKHWVSLRQSGILHKGLINKGSDPISFHVPLRGVLEWATVEDSARLMVNVCGDEVPESFWRRFYNIGSGKEFRLSNYRFEQLLLKALGCPPPEKVFETNWFATRNFHGEWYEDSDLLEEILHFREPITSEDYFDRWAKGMPWFMKLTPLVPAFLIKEVMKRVAKTKDLGTLDWFRRKDCEDRINAFYGSREARAQIPDWDSFDLSEPSDTPVHLNHGYDESKSETELDIDDMRGAAAFRGGKCLSETMRKGDLDSKLEWECAFGHRFQASPRLVLLGGHWCPDCLPAPWKYDEEAEVNPFIAQVWKSNKQKG